MLRRIAPVAVAVALAAAPALAQEVKPEEAAKMRQGVMTAIKWQFAPIGAVVKGERPFDTDVTRRASSLATLAKIVPEGFVVPSGSDIVKSSKAKPAVWQDSRAFGELMRQLVTETDRLALAAQSRKPEELRAQFLVVSKVCKDCHDKFRAE